MNLRIGAMAAATAAIVAAAALLAACEFEGESASEPARISTAGLSAGDAALFGIAQGAQQRTSLATVTQTARAKFTSPARARFPSNPTWPS